MTTKIEWTNETWNPVTGCSKVSAGCKHCYAERMSHRLKGRFGYPADDPFKVTLHPDRLNQPLKWKKPRQIFVCSMGDLFHEDVPFEYITRVFDTMVSWRRPSWKAREAEDWENLIDPGHTFQVLTKRPERIAPWIEWVQRNQSDYDESGIRPKMTTAEGWPAHIWLGTSVENQATADERIPHLLKCPAAVRFLSCEPLLGPVDLVQSVVKRRIGDPQPDWVICGAETGPGARPMNPDWARSIRDQCKAAGTPYFFKRMGSAWKGETPDDLMVREMPTEIGATK